MSGLNRSFALPGVEKDDTLALVIERAMTIL
jgi:hypothetical protein